jgi:hypothetical protein
MRMSARGDLQGAIDKFIAARDLAPGNATIQEHLRRANIALAAVLFAEVTSSSCECYGTMRKEEERLLH